MPCVDSSTSDLHYNYKQHSANEFDKLRLMRGIEHRDTLGMIDRAIVLEQDIDSDGNPKQEDVDSDNSDKS